MDGPAPVRGRANSSPMHHHSSRLSPTPFLVPSEESLRRRSHSADELTSLVRWAPFGCYGAVVRLKHLVGRETTQPVHLGHALAQGTVCSRVATDILSMSSITSSVPPLSSMTECVTTLTKTILGSGLLSLPYVCHVNGILPSAVYLVLFACLSGYSMYLLVRATDLAHLSHHAPLDMDFGALGHLAFGNAGLRAVQIVIGVDLWGTLVAYMVVIADVLQPAVEASTLGTSFHYLCSRWVVILASAVAVLPLCTGKGIGALGPTAALGLLALGVFMMFLVFRGINRGFGERPHRPRPEHVWHLGLGLLRTLPIMAFLYNVHFNVFSVYNALERRTPARMGVVIASACAISTAVALGVGTAGDLLYHPHVKENVLQNMRLDDRPALAVRSLFGLAIVLSYPVVAFELRQMTEALFAGRRTRRLPRVVIAGALVLSSSLTAITVPNITVAFGMVGGTTTTAMAFVLPPAFFLKLYYKQGMPGSAWRTAPVWIILALGIVGVPLLTSLTLRDALR